MSPDHQTRPRTLLCPNPPGLVKRMIPRLFRSNLALAEEDIMSDRSDLALKMKAFSYIFEKGNSRQLLGLFETGLCPQDREQELVWKFSQKLSAEVSFITSPIGYNSSEYDPHREYYSKIALDHRHRAYSSLWSVLQNGYVKNPEVQKAIFQLVISNFSDIITENFDLSKLDDSTVLFIKNNNFVRKELKRREEAKTPSIFRLASELSSKASTIDLIYNEAVDSANQTSFEVCATAFFMRLNSDLSGPNIAMAKKLFFDEWMTHELFKRLLPSICQAMGINELILLRDHNHLRVNELGTEKLNALKIYLNEIEYQAELKNNRKFSNRGYGDYSGIYGDSV